MAIFTILVTQAPFESQAAYSAIKFTLSAIEEGHQVNGVFFYQGGTANANGLQIMLGDDLNLFEKWQQVSACNIPLLACVSAANRRGVINQQDAIDADLEHYNVKAPFSIVGLGDFVTLSNQADRVVQF